MHTHSWTSEHIKALSRYLHVVGACRCFHCVSCSEGSLAGGHRASLGLSSLTWRRSSSKGSSCAHSLSCHLDLCLRVRVHGWTVFYSLAALMLLEIRMLTQSLICLHRSHPSQRNHSNSNVRYKLCSSLHPLALFLHLLLCQCWFRFE